MPGTRYPKRGGTHGDALSLALACKCPNCGKGPLYAGLLSVSKTCKACGFPLSEIDTGDGAAAFIILVLGAIIVPLVLWIEFTFRPPFLVHIFLWPPLVTIASILFMRPVKAWLIHQQFRHYGGGKI